MKRRMILITCLVITLSFVGACISCATDEPAKKENIGQKTKSFIQKLFSYPANVIQGSVDVACDTGKKGTDKFYYRHSGYPGGFRKESLNEALEKKPIWPLEHAIRGMLPRNRLGSAMFRKLRVYVGAEHPHLGQTPVKTEA